MTEQLDGTIIDQDGAPVAAATIAVRDADGALVTLTDAGGNSEANPLTTDSNGAYDVQVPATGIYYLTVTKGQASLVLTKTVASTVSPRPRSQYSCDGPLGINHNDYSVAQQAVTLPD